MSNGRTPTTNQLHNEPATYADYLVVHQNVTVGTDRGRQPRLGEGVVLFGGAAVIGDCDIGCNVSISVHSTVRNTSVFSSNPNSMRAKSLFQTVTPMRRLLIRAQDAGFQARWSIKSLNWRPTGSNRI